jgi:hypothetical protein
MIQVTGWVVIRQPFDRVEQRQGDPPIPARWRWALSLTVAVLALVPPAAQSKATAMPDAPRQEPGDPPKSDLAKTSLPPRAVLRIGTESASSIHPPGNCSGRSMIRFNSLTRREQRRFLAEWRTPEQQKAGKPEVPETWEAAFSPDGRVLATSQLEWIYVWDVASATMRRKFRHPHGHGCKLALAPNGRTLATSDIRGDIHDIGEDTIRLYDVESGNQTLTVEPERRARNDAGT